MALAMRDLAPTIGRPGLRGVGRSAADGVPVPLGGFAGRQCRDGVLHGAGLARRAAAGSCSRSPSSPGPGRRRRRSPVSSRSGAATGGRGARRPAARRGSPGQPSATASVTATLPPPPGPGAVERLGRGRDERRRRRRRRPGSGRRRPTRRPSGRPRPAAPRSRRGPAARRSCRPSPGAISTNSSPPIRPTVSTSRTDSARTAATRRSTSSPAAWPPSRFVAWKSSTSNIASETSPPWRPARASSSSRIRADGPLVGQAGQRVGVGHPLEPLGALRGGRGEARPVDGHRRQPGECRQRLALGVVQLVRRRPAEPDRAEGHLDAAARRRAAAGRHRRTAAPSGMVACRSNVAARLVAASRTDASDRPSRPRGAQSAGVVDAVRGGELQARPVRVRDDDRAHRRARRPSSAASRTPSSAASRSSALGDRRDRRGEGRRGDR